MLGLKISDTQIRLRCGTANLFDTHLRLGQHSFLLNHNFIKYRKQITFQIRPLPLQVTHFCVIIYQVIFEVILYFIKKLHVYNVSIHRNFDQNWFMNEYARRKKAKIPESQSPGVFQFDIEELTFLISQSVKEGTEG